MAAAAELIKVTIGGLAVLGVLNECRHLQNGENLDLR